MQEIKITSRNFELDATVKDYVLKKIRKHRKLLTKATLVEVELISVKTKNSSTINYEIEISVKVPNDFLKVKESNKEILTVIDMADNTLFRQLEKYKDSYDRKKITVEKVAYETIDDLGETEEIYNYYEPLIQKRSYQDDRPKHPAEAIEQMEIQNLEAYLFKNIETEKYSMVYKTKDGKYGLIEPQSE